MAVKGRALVGDGNALSPNVRPVTVSASPSAYRNQRMPMPEGRYTPFGGSTQRFRDVATLGVARAGDSELGATMSS